MVFQEELDIIYGTRAQGHKGSTAQGHRGAKALTMKGRRSERVKR
jgi:hypothetical protein